MAHRCNATSTFPAKSDHPGFVSLVSVVKLYWVLTSCYGLTGSQAKAALEAAGLKPEIAEVTMRAENTIELAGEDAQRMQKLLDVIEDLDDVQDVFHNAVLDDQAS